MRVAAQRLKTIAQWQHQSRKSQQSQQKNQRLCLFRYSYPWCLRNSMKCDGCKKEHAPLCVWKASSAALCACCKSGAKANSEGASSASLLAWQQRIHQPAAAVARRSKPWGRRKFWTCAQALVFFFVPNCLFPATIISKHASNVRSMLTSTTNRLQCSDLRLKPKSKFSTPFQIIIQISPLQLFSNSTIPLSLTLSYKPRTSLRFPNFLISDSPDIFRYFSAMNLSACSDLLHAARQNSQNRLHTQKLFFAATTAFPAAMLSEQLSEQGGEGDAQSFHESVDGRTQSGYREGRPLCFLNKI